MWHSRPVSTPPPFMANAILNFHFDYWHTSLIWFEGPKALNLHFHKKNRPRALSMSDFTFIIPVITRNYKKLYIKNTRNTRKYQQLPESSGKYQKLSEGNRITLKSSIYQKVTKSTNQYNILPTSSRQQYQIHRRLP